MAFNAIVLNVLLASPGDTTAARDAVEAATQSWNRDRARTEKAVLLPLRWEVDAVPELGMGDGQEVINRQLVDESDLVIGLFHSRLGQPTARDVSGAVEELRRSVARGAKVHVYFADMPLPSNVDTAQLDSLRRFKDQIEALGLLGTFTSIEDLTAKVRTALERDVSELASVRDEFGRADNWSGQAQAVLRVRFDYDREQVADSKGRLRTRRRRERLEIENIGNGAAESVVLSVEPVGEGEPPVLHDAGAILRIPPHGLFKVPVVVHGGVAMQWRVRLAWEEDGRPREEFVSVSGV